MKFSSSSLLLLFFFFQFSQEEWKIPLPPFEYKAYWKRAEELALLERRQVQEYQPFSDCVKVFVYDMPKTVQGALSFDEVLDPSRMYKGVFNTKNNDRPYEFYTGQSTEDLLFFYRLVVDNHQKGNRKSVPSYCGYDCEWKRAQQFAKDEKKKKKGCYLTKDPNEADLFLIPILLEVGKWGRCENPKKFSQTMYDLILENLVHLNSTNACSHFMMKPQGTYYGGDCAKGYFLHPTGPFKKMLRVTGTPMLSKESIRNGYTMIRREHASLETEPNEHPYLISTPYPTNIHWSNSFEGPTPWARKEARTILMLFSTKEFLHGDTPVRRKIREDCARYKEINENICRVDLEGSFGTPMKEKAIFCLEPIGDSPFRKSIFDSLTAGCIPVLFSEFTDASAPYHWDGWRNRTRVLISRWDYTSGRIDLKKLLESIPQSLVSLLQQSIEEVGRRFQTSLHYDPGDSHSFILRGIADQKAKCEEDLRKPKLEQSDLKQDEEKIEEELEERNGNEDDQIGSLFSEQHSSSLKKRLLSQRNAHEKAQKETAQKVKK